MAQAAGWIEAPVQSPSQLFRKEFVVKKKVNHATIWATAQGLYELRMNGLKVGDELFAPSWTSYNHHLQVQEYDVTALVQEGNNTIGFIPGNGWYRSRMARVRGHWTSERHYGYVHR